MKVLIIDEEPYMIHEVLVQARKLAAVTPQLTTLDCYNLLMENFQEVQQPLTGRQLRRIKRKAIRK